MGTQIIRDEQVVAYSWQPIETCPKNCPVLLWEKIAKCATVGIWCECYTKPFHALVHGEDALWNDDNGSSEQPIFEATHWMSLPPAPSEAIWHNIKAGEPR